MEKCQKDGIRVVASERKLSTENTEFGKKKNHYFNKKNNKIRKKNKRFKRF